MPVLPAFERVPPLTLTKTAITKLRNGLCELIAVYFGHEKANECVEIAKQVDELRDNAFKSVSGGRIPFGDMKKSIFAYCFQIECLLKLLPKEADFSPYFVFQWTPIDSNDYVFSHHPKFDQMCFLFFLVLYCLQQLPSTGSASEELKAVRSDCLLCESILNRIQSAYPEPPILSFFPGILAVLLGLMQLYREQAEIELTQLSKPSAMTLAQGFTRQAKLCDNVLSDLETCLPLFQKKFEDFITLKKQLCQANAHLQMAGTFTSEELAYSRSHIDKADLITKTAFQTYKSLLGPLEQYFMKTKDQISAITHDLYSQTLSKAAPTALPAILPTVPFTLLAEPFQFGELIVFDNLFAPLCHVDENFAPFEYKFKCKLISLFNLKLEDAKRLTDEYYSSVSAFRFEEVLEAKDKPLPDSLQNQSVDFSSLQALFVDVESKVASNLHLIKDLEGRSTLSQLQRQELQISKTRNAKIEQSLVEDSEIIDKLEALSSHLADNFEGLPTLIDVDFGPTEPAVTAVRKLLSKGEEMVLQRDALITSLKSLVLDYDCGHKYTDVDPELIAEKCFSELSDVDRLCVNFNAQSLLISHLINKNTEIYCARETVRRIFSSRAASFKEFEDLLSSMQPFAASLENRRATVSREYQYLNGFHNHSPLPEHNSVSVNQEPFQPQVDNTGPLVYAQSQPSSQFTLLPGYQIAYPVDLPGPHAPPDMESLPREVQLEFVLSSIKTKFSELNVLIQKLYFLMQPETGTTEGEQSLNPQRRFSQNASSNTANYSDQSQSQPQIHDVFSRFHAPPLFEPTTSTPSLGSTLPRTTNSGGHTSSH